MTSSNSVCGYLVRGPSGAVRLLVGEYCFDFARADVVEMCQVDVVTPGAILVEVRLRVGASLLGVHEAALLQVAASAGVTPFAIATRPARPIVPAAPGFVAAEAAYLRRHGLVDD